MSNLAIPDFEKWCAFLFAEVISLSRSQKTCTKWYSLKLYFDSIPEPLNTVIKDFLNFLFIG